MFDQFIINPVIAINNRIQRLSTYGKPQESFLNSSINEFKQSEERKDMIIAQEYYGNKNKIKDNVRTYINRLGVATETELLSNNKLSHPFVRKLANQKVNYLLGSPPTFKTDNELLTPLITEKFNAKFIKKLNNLGRESITKGIAWCQVYYDGNGVLSFKRIPAHEIIAFWADADHTILDGIIRFYTMTMHLSDGSKEDIEKVEYYTDEGVWYYIQDNDGLQPDPDHTQRDVNGEITNTPQGNFKVNKPRIDVNTGEQLINADTNKPEIEVIDIVWDKIPFVAFKYNVDEQSILTWVKPIVDDYDKKTSDNSNIIQDIPNNIKVVKNYDGTDKEEFTTNLNMFRVAFVAEDGDLKSVDTPLEVEAMEAHLTRTRKDIFAFGNGVDNQDESIGDPSGIALKFLYGDLDSDCKDMAAEFSDSLDQLVWFIKVDATNRTLGEFEDAKFEVVYNIDTIMNVKEQIEDCVASANIPEAISLKTIQANHPWVTDIEEENKQIEIERAEATKRADEQMAKESKIAFNTGGDVIA